MANISIQNGNLVVTMQGLRKFLTFKSELSFPISSVRGVTHDPTIQSDYPSGWDKKVGTNVFNTYYGGTFRDDGDTIFWDVRHPEKTIVITLADQDYQRLIVEVNDPKSTVREIETALATTR